METIYVETVYTFSAAEAVELPEGKTWNDVRSYYVCYGVLHLLWMDGTSTEHDLDGPALEDQDWKTPDEASVYAAGPDGSPDFTVAIGVDGHTLTVGAAS
jgi:hypothetical protein